MKCERGRENPLLQKGFYLFPDPHFLFPKPFAAYPFFVFKKNGYAIGLEHFISNTYDAQIFLCSKNNCASKRFEKRKEGCGEKRVKLS
jgi:hypothetical protein